MFQPSSVVCGGTLSPGSIEIVSRGEYQATKYYVAVSEGCLRGAHCQRTGANYRTGCIRVSENTSSRQLGE
jgi:hypothetical protein